MVSVEREEMDDEYRRRTRLTLQEKMAKILNAENNDAMYEAVQKLTDNQKDIAIVTLIRALRGEKPKGWDEAMNTTFADLIRKVENEEIAD